MNIYRFIPNKISALLLTLICVLTLAACAGGGSGGSNPPAGPSLLNLRIIPDTNNATLIWDNPDAEIASINITYYNRSTPDALQYFPLITDEASIRTNATNVTKMIDDLTNGEIYSFRVALEFGGADVNKSIIAEEIRRLIGPNLDQDEYADADPLETDEDGDGTNDNLDAFPRNTTLSAFTVTELSARSGNGEVTLSWNNPAANISSIRISYHNTNAPNDLQRHPLIEDSPRTNSSATNVEETIDGLTNGQSYNFTVRLILDRDDAGKKVVVASTTATPGIFAVTDLVATPGAGSVILNWNNPDADIASISISYGITDSGASTTVGASNTGRSAIVEQTITGLTNGQSYTFNISLTLQNDDAGREGEAVSDTATPNVFAVTDLTAIPNDSSVTLSWINPDADIASVSISYYEVTGSGASTTAVASNIGREASVEETIDGLDNGVSYNFTVDLILADDYAGREGPALSIIVGIGPNDDGDGIADFLDVDADGDGLIEISTAEQLNQIRYNLLGSSLNTSDGVAGDASGCGGQPDISECNGYELTQNISLDGYNSDNWIPIGICRGVRTCNSESSFFDAIFDGNGWTISNLTITNPAALYNNATGLFGAISPDSILRNIHIRSANISGVMNNVGLLAGSAVGAKISNSSVEGEVTARGGQVGGLVGIGDRATITLSYAKFSSVRGDVNVGGLVGFGEDATITSSYATGGSVRGRGEVGGLVGRGDSAEIMSSYAEVGAVSGSFNYAGGMIGLGQGVTITSSYAKVGAVSGSRNLGGLVGGGQSATITSSYAEVGSINGSSTTSGGIGGLVGTTTTAKGSVTIISSYAATGTLSNASSENTLGGLLGFGTLNAASSNSYWNSDTSGVTRTIGSTTGNSEGRTTAQLQILTDFIGIYATWATNMCDDGSRAWNLGLNDQYPALTCTPGGAPAQRP